MGDANSWLIFLIGLFALALVGVTLAVGCVVGIVYLVRRNQSAHRD